MATFFMLAGVTGGARLEVSRLMNPEGVPLVRCERAKLNFRGWLSETPKAADLERRKVIDALEQQVTAWSG